MRSIENCSHSLPPLPHIFSSFSLCLPCIDVDIHSLHWLPVPFSYNFCMIHIVKGNDLNISFSLVLSNPVQLYISIYCIMLVNSEIKYCLNLKDFLQKKKKKFEKVSRWQQKSEKLPSMQIFTWIYLFLTEKHTMWLRVTTKSSHWSQIRISLWLTVNF